jgi:hypothetical protein
MKKYGSWRYSSTILDLWHGQHHASTASQPGKGASVTYWTGGWIGPRVCPDATEGKNLSFDGNRTPKIKHLESVFVRAELSSTL